MLRSLIILHILITIALSAIATNQQQQETLLKNEEEEEQQQQQPVNGTKFGEWIFTFLGITTTTPKPRATPAPKLCDECACSSTTTLRIVNGSETNASEVPWLASLTYQNNFLCAGTLITPRYLLTSAHTMSIAHIEQLRAIFPTTTTTRTNETRRISKIAKHPQFDYSYDNDIALLKMDRPMEDTPTVCLIKPNVNVVGLVGRVYGWGSYEEFGPYPNRLRHIDVPIWERRRCVESYAHRITDNMFCAGSVEGGKDACKGDSGGPLVVLHPTNGTPRIVGVVSWGFGCAEPNFPGVYTNLTNYYNWFNYIINDSCLCY